MPTISLSFPSYLKNSSSPPSFSIQKTPPTPPTQQSPRPPPNQQPMDAVELRRVFEMFDQNGDGRISLGELTTSLSNMGIAISDDDLSLMIGRIDQDGDGCVDNDEFEALYRLIMEEHGNDMVDEEEDMKEAFNVFDKNGDGFISVDELRTVLGSLGLGNGRSLEDCKLMIMKVDVDGDGRVSFKEFKKMMKGGGFATLT